MPAKRQTSSMIRFTNRCDQSHVTLIRRRERKTAADVDRRRDRS